MNKCPCLECVCVPMCKYKTIGEINECELVNQYITKKLNEPYRPPMYYVLRWNEVCDTLGHYSFKFNPKHFD